MQRLAKGGDRFPPWQEAVKKLPDGGRSSLAWKSETLCLDCYLVSHSLGRCYFLLLLDPFVWPYSLFSEAPPYPDFHFLALHMGMCVCWLTLPLEVDGFSLLDEHYGFSTFCLLIPVPFWLPLAYVVFDSPILSLTPASVFQPGLINVLLCRTGTTGTLTHDYLSR